MRILNFLYEKIKKFYGWHIKVVSTAECECGLKIPKFIPAFTKDMLPRLNNIRPFLYSEGLDFDSENYKNDYLKLIRGLDEDSIRTVESDIEIYKQYFQLLKKKKVTLQELCELHERLCVTKDDYNCIRENFFNKISKINDNLYRYNEYYLTENQFASNVFYYKHKIDELKTLNTVMNKNIIDVGGFVGDSAIILSKYTKKNVYSFEASGINFNKMKQNLELNNIKNVISVNVALGDISDTMCSLSGESSSTHVEELMNSSMVNLTTLDKYVFENNIDVGLIKVDIEGYEQKFLKGAEQTIKTQKPVLLISIYHSPDDYFHIKPLLESWNPDYTFRVVHSQETPLFETLLIAENIKTYD